MQLVLSLQNVLYNGTVNLLSIESTENSGLIGQRFITLMEIFTLIPTLLLRLGCCQPWFFFYVPKFSHSPLLQKLSELN